MPKEKGQTGKPEVGVYLSNGNYLNIIMGMSFRRQKMQSATSRGHFTAKGFIRCFRRPKNQMVQSALPDDENGEVMM